MTDATQGSTTTATTEPTLNARVAYAFCKFSGGFWRGPTAARAWGLTLGLALCLAASTAVTVALNQWNRSFFDALETKNVSAFSQATITVAVIVALMAAVGVGIVLTRETLQVRWREWLIDQLLKRWLGERRFYHLAAARTEPANPEYRIADDTRWAVEHLTDLAIGLVIAVLNAATFISVLWTVGGAYTLSLGASTVMIPAYMVLVALAYGALMSILMVRVGWRLPGVVYAKNEREGDFRFAMMRLRENAESVAVMSGHHAEQTILRRMFDRVVASWTQVISKHGHLTWITNTTGPLLQNQIVPLLFAAPKYLSGELTLGQVTQLAGAFVIVQGAISWIVDNFSRFSEWYASAKRIMDIIEACDELDRKQATAGVGICFDASRDPGLSLARLAVRDPFGKPVISNINLTARPGSSTLVSGETSVGKSSLVRAVAGLWTDGEGAIRIPDDARVMIVPQKPYVPLGTLRETLTYPDTGRPIADDALRSALERVGLTGLGDELDVDTRWDQRLSNGERQRLAIARVLAQQPDVILLDDALSALDAAAQGELIRAVRGALPKAILISLGQTLPPAGLHDQVVNMTRSGIAATIHMREREKT